MVTLCRGVWATFHHKFIWNFTFQVFFFSCFTCVRSTFWLILALQKGSWSYSFPKEDCYWGVKCCPSLAHWACFQNEPLSVCSLLHELLYMCVFPSCVLFPAYRGPSGLSLHSEPHKRGGSAAGAVQQCFKMMCRGGVLREAPEAGVVDRPDRCQPRTQSPFLGRVTGDCCLVYWSVRIGSSVTVFFLGRRVLIDTVCWKRPSE